MDGTQTVVDQDQDLRARAVERLERKHEFYSHLYAFVLVNAVLVAIWAVTGAGYFWPVFPMLGWGVGLLFHAQAVFGHGPTESDIRHEMERLA